jgi:cysteine desulfurase
MKMDNRTTISILSCGLFTLSVVTSVLALRKQQQRACSDDSTIIYLDYNGTTPVDPVVLNAMIPYLQEHFGNPSSSHALGDAPRQAIERARLQILTHLLGVGVNRKQDSAAAMAESIVFTGCGTEADNLAIHLALQLKRGTSESLPHIVTTNVEHPAVEVYLQVQEQIGRCTVTRVPVQPNGCVTAEDMIAAIQSNTYVVQRAHGRIICAIVVVSVKLTIFLGFSCL